MFTEYWMGGTMPTLGVFVMVLRASTNLASEDLGCGGGNDVVEVSVERTLLLMRFPDPSFRVMTAITMILSLRWRVLWWADPAQ